MEANTSEMEFDKLEMDLIGLDGSKSRFRKSHGIVVVFIVWVLMCLQTLVCLCPIFCGTSLWMSHIDFKLEDAEGSLWFMAMQESLSLLSSLSNDIHGLSVIDERAVASISKNKYTFDFASWCRSNSHTKSAVCYRGPGLDVITSFITDFGAQVGEFGNSEDPNQLGMNLANTYIKAITELDEVYVHTIRANEKTTIDMEKLKLVHQLKKSRTVGHAMWILKTIHGTSVASICAYKFAPIIKRFSFYNNVKCRGRLTGLIFAVSLLIVCQLCTFVIVVTESLFAAILNTHLAPYGVCLVHGPAFFLLLLEFMLGALVTYHIIIY